MKKENSHAGDKIPMETMLSTVPRETAVRIFQYAKLAVDWNLHINLTGAKNLQTFISKHILDCVFAFQALQNEKFWIDVGTGAGLPGIIWALLQPQGEFLLVESIQKKISFLRRAQSLLKIENLEIFPGRLENLSEEFLKKTSSEFPCCVSRGTNSPDELLTLAKNSSFSWKQWIVFCSEKTEREFLTLGKKFGMRVSTISYSGPKEEIFKKSVLVVLEKEK